MNSISASKPALNIIALNPSALAILYASSTAMSALYSVSTKINYTAGQTWASVTAAYSAKGLFIRMTTKGNPAGWGEGATTNSFLRFDGVTNEYSRNTATNPYIQTEHPLRYFATTLSFYEYNPFEIAYIDL